MSKNMIVNAISAVLAMGLASAGTTLLAANNIDKQQKNGQETLPISTTTDGEKCYGIARAGRNDCSTATNNCAGESKKDGEKSAWITVPTGVCNKIIGGSKDPIKS